MLNNLLGKCMSRKVFPRIAVKMFHIPRVRLVRLAWWLHVFGCRSYSERRGDHGHGAQVVTLEKVGAVAASINSTTTPDTHTPARLVFSQQPPLLNIYKHSTNFTIKKFISSSQNLSACINCIDTYNQF